MKFIRRSLHVRNHGRATSDQPKSRDRIPVRPISLWSLQCGRIFFLSSVALKFRLAMWIAHFFPSSSKGLSSRRLPAVHADLA